MVELLAVVDGVDDVDALAVEFLRELVDGAADDGEVEVTAGGVGQFATGRDDLVANVSKFAASGMGIGRVGGR